MRESRSVWLPALLQSEKAVRHSRELLERSYEVLRQSNTALRALAHVRRSQIAPADDLRGAAEMTEPHRLRRTHPLRSEAMGAESPQAGAGREAEEASESTL